jgi:hypothetical protein
MLNKTSLVKLIAIVGFTVMLSACAVTTRSTEATTETIENTSEASTDFTSSTSPRDEEKDSQAHKIKTFAAVNIDRLKEDMARGNGEHLTAFAHLLGIPEIHRAEFFALTKQKYPILFNSEPTTSEDMLAKLNTELNDHPGLRQ